MIYSLKEMSEKNNKSVGDVLTWLTTEKTDELFAAAARAIYVGISAGIAGPLLTTPGADYADDRQLAKNAGYGV